jgi:hypothetical protein
MKKVFLLILGIVLFASSNDEFLDYTNKLVTYNFELKNFDKIKSPFFRPKKHTFIQGKGINQNVKKIVHISLLSIFNNSAYVKIEEFKGDELIKKYKRWVKKGDKIEQCKLIKIYLDKIVLKCNNHLLVKKLNEKSLKIRIEK